MTNIWGYIHFSVSISLTNGNFGIGGTRYNSNKTQKYVELALGGEDPVSEDGTCNTVIKYVLNLSLAIAQG